MKNSVQPLFSDFSRKATPLLVAIVLPCFAGLNAVFAENAQEARVTRIVNDVKLVGASAAARPAVLSDPVKPGNGVRTGADSRAELTFQDLSITRLGANTVFSFNGAGRTVDLGGGAVLVEAPPNSAAIHVNTAAFSAAVSGGTGLIEFHLGGVSKVLILEGQGDITSNGNSGEIIVVTAGNMVTLGPDGKWTKPQKFNVALVMKSSNLITDFGSLPNEQLIFQVIDQQQNDFGKTNNEPPHDTTLDATVDRNNAAPPGGGPTPNPTPPGNIPVITSPNPYVIGSGTTITTDPTITTNAQTNQGAIYHGQATDGPLSAFIFGSTSAFDTAIGLDTNLGETNDAALFKFTALQLTGNPTIDTTNGPTDLGLVALNGITSGGPGGVIDFAGLRGVLLATQNGPITLGSEISFANIHDLNFYARGTNGTLSLASAISGLTHTRLFSEQTMSLSSTIQTETILAISGGNMTISGTNTIQAPSIELFSFQGLSWGGETSDMTPTNSDGTVTIEAVGNINVTNDLSFTRHSSGNPTGPDLTLSGGQDVTLGGVLSLIIDNRNGGSMDTGGNITVNANGNLTVNGNSGIELDVFNNGGQIGSGGNISLAVGGNVTAEGLDALVISGDGGTIGHGVTVSVSAGGALNLGFGSQLIINTSAQSTSNGGTIGGDALIQVTAGSVSTPNSNNLWFISNNDGGHIQGNATLSVNIAGNASFGNGSLFDIENHSVNTLNGGAIDGNAVIDFSAGNVSAGDASLIFQILNQANGDGQGGQIGGNASVTIHSGNLASGSGDTGPITAQINNQSATITGGASISLTATGAVGSAGASTVTFSILNGNFGSIGQDAAIHATMASLATGNSATFSIGNNFGIIGADATVNVVVTGSSGVNLSNFGTFTIDNSVASAIQPREISAGIFGGATVELDVQHGGFTDASGLEVSVDNHSSFISNDTNVTANVAHDVTISNGDATFQILNNYGHIGGAASVSASAGSLSANNVVAQIDNSNGSINGSAEVSVNVTGGVTASNGVLLQILNEGGAIGAGAAGNGVTYTAGGTTTANSLQLYVDNSNNGEISNGGNQVLNATGPVILNGPLGMELDNYSGGFLGTGGNLTAHFEGDVTDTAGSMHSFNFFVINGGDGSVFVGPLAGGTIGTGGNIDLTFDGNVATTPTTTTGSFGIEIANDTGSITDGGNITVTSGGNVTARIVSSYISNRNGTITNGANITFNTTGTITTTGFANFEVLNIGGTIGNNPEINVHAGSFNVGTALVSDYDNEGGSIGPGGTGQGSVSITSDGDITVGAGLWVLGSVTSGGTISARRVAATDVTATTAINAGVGGITQFQYVDGNNTIPLVTHILTAPSITSSGGINFNGPDSDGNSPGQDGGTLILNPNSISFDPAGDIQGSVTLNGGAGAGNESPGNGGSLTVNAAGAVTVNSDIEATTGSQDSTAAPGGTGGNVSLNSTGNTVTVNSRIEVSSDDPTPSQTPPPPIRRSNAGGNITLTSAKATGTAIQVTNTAQLLSLLDNAATGPGGVITVKATGGSSSVAVQGKVEADRGTIDVEQTGTNGSVVLGNNGGASINGPNAASFFGLNMRADVIKVGALGTNGTLLVGNALLNADTLIALYGGSSGSVEFNANVTLSNATTKIIAANTVTIDNGVTVTIIGAAADVYTNHAHYDVASGGDGTGGSFSGSVNTHLGVTPPPFGQTSSVARSNSTTRSSTSSHAGASAPRTSASTASDSTRTANGSIQRIGILH